MQGIGARGSSMRRVIALVAVLMIGVAGVATAAVVFPTVHLKPGKCVTVKKARMRVCANPARTIVKTVTQWVTTTVPASITVPSTTTAPTPTTTTTTTSTPPPTTTTGTTTATPACVPLYYSGWGDIASPTSFSVPSFSLGVAQHFVWQISSQAGDVAHIVISNAGTAIVDQSGYTASGGFDLGPGSYGSMTVWIAGGGWNLSTSC